MKQLKILLVVGIISAGLVWPAGLAKASVEDFSFNYFRGEYRLELNENQASRMVIDEYLQAVFPDFDQNRGIERALPKIYDSTDSYLKIGSVDQAADASQSSTSSWNYSSYTENDNEVLRIGDKSTYVHGIQNYHVNYSVGNFFKTYPDKSNPQYDEVYWDVNGSDWPQTFSEVSAKIIMPKALGESLKDKACYTGGYGVTEQACQFRQAIEGDNFVLTVEATQPQNAYETLSFILAFPPGSFIAQQPSVGSQIIKAALLVLLFGSAIAIPLIALIIVVKKWRKYGRDPKGKGTIVAQYEAPKDSSLMINDFVYSQENRTIAMSAQILNLAIRGYVRIIDDGKDEKHHNFSLELLKLPTDLSAEETEVINMFFDDSAKVGKTVKIDDLKYKLYKKMRNLNEQVSASAQTGGWFATNTNKIKGTYAGLAITSFVLGGIFIFTFILLPLGIGLVLTGIILLIGAKIMPARTIKGVELRDYIEGLKLYIVMAEQERIRFHDSVDKAERKRFDINNPKTMVKIFETLLPYAMLFGMEKSWGKQFENLYTDQPDWYGGTNWTSFNAGYLAGSLSSFSAVSASSFSSPSSSSGSGFSGGGGFAGGGGGGGGGGGW